ncbi:MAG: hydrogenase maturation protease [Candidatus Omnitrophota bacterium]
MLNSSREIAVIGLGNTLRRDDGIGIHILSRLQDELKGKVAFLNFGIASFGLINFISEFRKVLLIDAMDAGLKPATMKIFRLDEAETYARQKKLSSHELSLADLLELYKALGLATDVQVAGIQVKDASYGLEMTPELAKAKNRIVQNIKEYILSWNKGQKSGGL